MKKWKIILLSICTFGIFYLVVHVKAKKISNEVNTQITYSKKIDLDISALMKYLGGKTNIKETTATISTLKIELNDIGLIDKLNIKKVINNKGMMFNGNQIILVLGDNALTICDAIKAAS